MRELPHDFTTSKDQVAVTNPHDLVNLGADQQHRFSGPGQFAGQIQDLRLGQHIHPARRLIQQKKAWLGR